MESKTLTIRLNEDQIPIIPPRPDAHLTFAIHNDGNERELTGNRAGLLLLAKAALGMAEKRFVKMVSTSIWMIYMRSMRRERR